MLLQFGGYLPRNYVIAYVNIPNSYFIMFVDNEKGMLTVLHNYLHHNYVMLPTYCKTIRKPT